MDTKTREIAAEVLQEVLENAAMFFVDPPSGEEITPPSDWAPIGCGLNFVGSRKGQINLWLDRQLAAAGAANILGMDEQNPAAVEMADDSVKELLNMVAGNFFTKITSTGETCKFGLPKMIQSSWRNSRNQATRIFVETEGTLAMLEIDEQMT